MEQLAEKVYVETRYADVNVGAVITKKGIICIDIPSYPRDARDWVTQLHLLDPRPIRYIILTNTHGDRLLNMRWFNAPLIVQQSAADKLNSYDKRYPQSLLDSLIARNLDAGRELNNAPVERAAISFSHDLSLYYNHKQIKLVYMPGPETGSICVHLVDAGILFTGDLLTVDTCPMLAQADTAAWLQSLERLRQPEYNAAVVVPGRGPLADSSHFTPMAGFIRHVRQQVFDLCRQNRPRSDLSACAADLLSAFPLGHLPRDWAQMQIRLGLDLIYDEMKTRVRLEQPG